MPSILEEFAYGNISPDVQLFKKDSEYGQAIALATCSEQKLLDRLGVDHKALFEKYVDMQGAVNRLTAVKNFVYGFKLGLMITAETFIGMDDLYHNGNNI